MEMNMKKKRQFTARLRHFEVVVTSTTRDDGIEMHRIKAGFAFENPPKDYEPPEFFLGSASEVLDMLEVVDESNVLIDSMVGGSDVLSMFTKPQITPLPDSNSEGGDAPTMLEKFADKVLTLLAASPDWGADTVDEIARLGVVHGLATSDEAGRFCRAAFSPATGGVTLAGGAA